MRDVLDVVGIAGDQSNDTPRLEGGDNAGGPSAPVIAAECRAVDSKRVHQRQQVCAERRLLA